MGLNVFEMFAKLSLDSSAFQKGLNVAKGDMQSLADATGSLVSKTVSLIGDLTKKGLALAENALTGFIKSAVETNKTFEQAIAGVSATLGQGSEEVIGDLREFAMQMGETTQYTATQAAEALNYMALAGYDAAKSMRVLPNVLNLAAAGGFDLARASDMVTDASSALQLTEEETTAMIDQMAAAASKSNTSIEQLGDAMLTVGGTARNLKGGTAELATVLGILADNGMKGSEGGTHLRNMINSLTKPTGDAKEMLDEMGVSLYDDTGAIRSLNDVFLDLKKSMAGMSDQARGETIATIFNARDMKAAEALLGGVGDRFNSLMQSMAESAGSAEEMRKKQENTLKGQVTIMNSAIEGLKINIGRGITPTLKEMAEFGADAFSMMNKAFKNNGLTGLFNELERWIPRLFDRIHEKVADFQDVFQRIVKLTAKTLPPLLKDGLMTVLAMITDFANTLTEPEMLDNLMTAGGDLLLAIVRGVINSWFNLSRIAARIVTALADYLEKNAGDLVRSAVSLITNFVKGLVEGDSLGKIVDGAIHIVKALANALASPGTLENLIGAAAELVGYIVTTATNPETIREISSLASSILHSLMDAFLKKENLDAVFNPDTGLPAILSNIIENLGTIATDLIGFAGDLLEKILSYFLDEENWETFKEGASKILVKLGEAFNDVTGAMDDLLFKLMKAIATMMGAKFDGTEAGEEIATKLAWAIWDNFKKNALWLPTAIGEWLADKDQADELAYLAEGSGPKRSSGSHSSTAKGPSSQSSSSHSSTGNTTADYYKQLGERGYATGGVVTRPIHALIGEAGAEAIVPLERNTGWIDGVAERITERIDGGVTIQFGNIYVSGDEDAGKKVAEQIDRALRDLQIQQARGIGGTAWKR